MKFFKLLFLSVFLFFTHSINAQDLFKYYESLLEKEEATISNIGKEVDSITDVYESNGAYLNAIKIAHEFSRELYRARLYEKAIHYSEYEISLYRKLDLKNSMYARALYNLGLFNSKNDNFEISKICNQEIIAINVDDYCTANAYCELGKYYYKEGDFFKADDYYSSGISELEKFDDYKDVLIIKYLDHVKVLLDMRTPDSLDRAKELLDKTNQFFNQGSTYSSHNYRVLNNYYTNYYSTVGRTDDDKAKFYTYRNLNKAIQDNDSTFMYTSYTSLGAIYIDYKSKEQKDSTLFFLKNGLKYARKTREKSVVYHQLSHFFLRNNYYNDALDNIQKSLMESAHLDQNIEALPNLNDLTVSDNQYHILLALIQKATILIKLYEQENNRQYMELALSNLLSADQLVDILLNVSKEEGSKLYWRKEASKIYLRGLLVSGVLNEKEKAFYFSEKKKALLLTGDILENTEKAQLPNAVLEQENELKKQILDLENRITHQKSKDRSTQLQNKRFELKQHYQALEDSLQVLFPSYYKDKETTKIVDLKHVQETLDEDNIIISYIANQDEYYDEFSLVYAILISKTQTEIIRIGELSSIEKLIRTYRDQLSKPFETEEDRLTFQKTASELYALLIPEDKISMSLDQKHLVIIPDGILQYIPFESLVVDKDTNRYLIEDNEISYVYSMSFLEHNAMVKRTPSQDLVAFAPVTFLHSNLEEVTNSIHEIDAIDTTISLDHYIEKEATQQNFLSKTEDYNIIHLATHANFSDKLQIAFHDTNLEYHELYTSKNQAELVVLSACNTSLGELAKGEGVMSLARGFFYAGANTVISSLWNANDKSATEIMGNFYSNLDKGQSKSKALHNAKIKYLKTNGLSDASPHYWATFVLIGDSETKLFPSYTLFYWVGFLLFIVVIIICLFFWLKKK